MDLPKKHPVPEVFFLDKSPTEQLVKVQVRWINLSCLSILQRRDLCAFFRGWNGSQGSRANVEELLLPIFVYKWCKSNEEFSFHTEVEFQVLPRVGRIDRATSLHITTSNTVVRNRWTSCHWTCEFCFFIRGRPKFHLEGFSGCFGWTFWFLNQKTPNLKPLNFANLYEGKFAFSLRELLKFHMRV